MDNINKNDNRLLHPNPQFFRDEWLDLSGEWKFKIDKDNTSQQSTISFDEDIEVPFSYETSRSGINDQNHHKAVWYKRTFTIEKDQYKGKRAFMHFAGVDYHVVAYLNDSWIGEHFGGYEEFSFEISDYLLDDGNENVLILKVEDSIDTNQPRGKQRWKDENFGCWYVQTTGVWKPVWIEFTGTTKSAPYITNIKVTPHFETRKIDFEVQFNADKLNEFPDDEWITIDVVARKNPDNTLGYTDVHTLRAQITKEAFKSGILTLSQVDDGYDLFSTLYTWSPEHPYLHDVEVILSQKPPLPPELTPQERLIKSSKHKKIIDQVHTYFGIREIKIEDSKIYLNGKELYQRLVLNQNYWDKTGLTPPSVEDMEKDLRKIKEFGYNGFRMHQTIADQRLLYLADKMGLLVWSEAPATYTFSDRAMKKFTAEWQEIVTQNYNHPSIITWVPFNESWGVPEIATDKKQQDFTRGIYYLTKAIDPYRPVITNDGWEHTISDIITLHDYEPTGKVLFDRYKDKNELMSNKMQHNKERYPFAGDFKYRGQPIIISEFGGIALENGEGWGYGEKVSDSYAFMKRFDKIHKAIQDLPFVSGYCYTQLTDVEQEVNGLLLHDHTDKFTPEQVEKIKEINTRRV